MLMLREAEREICILLYFAVSVSVLYGLDLDCLLGLNLAYFLYNTHSATQDRFTFRTYIHHELFEAFEADPI